jgi:hypothetical protein
MVSIILSYDDSPCCWDIKAVNLNEMTIKGDIFIFNLTLSVCKCVLAETEKKRRGITFELGYSGRSAIMMVTSQILSSVVVDEPRKAVKVRHPVQTSCLQSVLLLSRLFPSFSPLGPSAGAAPTWPKLKALGGIFLALRPILGIFVRSAQPHDVEPTNTAPYLCCR